MVLSGVLGLIFSEYQETIVYILTLVSAMIVSSVPSICVHKVCEYPDRWKIEKKKKFYFLLQKLEQKFSGT